MALVVIFSLNISFAVKTVDSRHTGQTEFMKSRREKKGREHLRTRSAYPGVCT